MSILSFSTSADALRAWRAPRSRARPRAANRRCVRAGERSPTALRSDESISGNCGRRPRGGREICERGCGRRRLRAYAARRMIGIDGARSFAAPLASVSPARWLSRAAMRPTPSTGAPDHAIVERLLRLANDGNPRRQEKRLVMRADNIVRENWPAIRRVATARCSNGAS